MCVKSLPKDSFRIVHMIDHILLLSSFRLGVGKASLLAGGGSISLQQQDVILDHCSDMTRGCADDDDLHPFNKASCL